MITEDYCSFEVAKLLEEKGFHAPDLHGLDSSLGHLWIKVTHQMAMKWLREKGVYLNIRIALSRMEDDVINNIHWVVDILNFSSGDWKDNDIWADTYEEAVEAALKHVLESDYFPELKEEDEKIKFESKFKPGDWVSNGRYVRKIIDINSDWPYYIFQDGSSYRIKEIDTKYHIMPNIDELEWMNMETNEDHCYSCELFDRKNDMCKCTTLCKEPHNIYKGFYIR